MVPGTSSTTGNAATPGQSPEMSGQAPVTLGMQSSVPGAGIVADATRIGLGGYPAPSQSMQSTNPYPTNVQTFQVAPQGPAQGPVNTMNPANLGVVGDPRMMEKMQQVQAAVSTMANAPQTSFSVQPQTQPQQLFMQAAPAPVAVAQKVPEVVTKGDVIRSALKVMGLRGVQAHQRVESVAALRLQYFKAHKD